MTADAAAPVKVEVMSFSDLFETSTLPLGVDTYQRGFVWGDEKIRQLADDLVEYQEKETSTPPYYMGTILLHQHEKKGRRFIIDGQQRITALCILHQQLTAALPANCALTYSPKSARRIQEAAKVFGDHVHRPDATVFENVVFTVISVNRVDLAFTFFDTQNNRGVPLHATDLLKAYHLRAVDDAATERKEALQTLCARRWEGIQQGVPVMSHDQEFAPSLFTKFLWRARCWTGRRVVYGDHDALMDEFQKKTWRADGNHATIPLYSSRHNRRGVALTLSGDGHSEIHTSRISLSPKAESLPFAIRQPIQKGIGFFLYADKYAALLRWLMVEDAESAEIMRFREVYEKLLMSNSVFLRETFLLASLMYADQFDDERLWEFSLWLEHALGEIRLEKEQVRYEAAQNFFKNGSRNLLDVIASGFRPEEVIAHLKTYHAHREVYASEAIEVGKGVQGVYKQAVLAYYSREAGSSLAGKDGWIAAKLKGAGK